VKSNRRITYKLRKPDGSIDERVTGAVRPEPMVGQVIDDDRFTEKLPPSCPPDEAVLAAYENVWRYVSNNPPSDEDFHSHAKLKKPLPNIGITLCEWSSCSLFLSDNNSYRLLPKPKKKFAFIAKLKITNSCGYTQSNGKHVHFWRFKDVSPNVTAVFPL
jgi:hypothetical protein